MAKILAQETKVESIGSSNSILVEINGAIRRIEVEDFVASTSDGAYADDILAYGIQFDTEISDPTCTRIGSSSLHRQLPIQSRMKGCLLNDDGTVASYLGTSDWTAYDRSGVSGQVMVEIPAHYRKFVTNGTVRQVFLSEYPVVGYHLVPKMYVSAYEASLQRSNTTLCSVVNTGTDYRGGDNATTNDSAANTLLGRAATSISLTNFRTYARKRNTATTEWNCYTYQAQKAIYWLFVTEYATLNSQAAINSALTDDGYKQGGLGDGPTTVSSTDWTTFNGQMPFIPCGYTDSLGNGTGEISYTATANGVTLTTMANRYRGVENPFGYIFKWADGILVYVDSSDNGTNDVYTTDDPALFSSTSYSNYSFVGNQARTSSSYIKEILFGVGGDIIGSVVGGSSSTYFCDNNYTSITTSEIKGVRFGGVAVHGSSAGLACSGTYYSPSSAGAYCGSRLCFHPAE